MHRSICALVLFIGFGLTAYGQSDWTDILFASGSNGCFVSNLTPKVYQIADPHPSFNGIIPRPPIATLTGGIRVGGPSACMGIPGGYATSHTDQYGNVMPLGNTLTISLQRPVDFDFIDIDGRPFQNISVSINGRTFTFEMDADGHTKVNHYDLFLEGPRPRTSTITVSSSDPDWRFGLWGLRYYDVPLRNGELAPGCSSDTQQRPLAENHSKFDWTMRSEISDNEGLVLSNVRLKDRLMAERISIPYYRVQLNASSTQRGELRPSDAAGGDLQSRLVYYNALWNDDVYIIRATYAIRPVPSSSACLTVTQD
jgi:hypothetical protein